MRYWPSPEVLHRDSSPANQSGHEPCSPETWQIQVLMEAPRRRFRVPQCLSVGEKGMTMIILSAEISPRQCFFQLTYPLRTQTIKSRPQTRFEIIPPPRRRAATRSTRHAANQLPVIAHAFHGISDIGKHRRSGAEIIPSSFRTPTGQRRLDPQSFPVSMRRKENPPPDLLTIYHRSSSSSISPSNKNARCSEFA